MHEGRTVFSQIVDFVPRHTFRRRVERYRGDYGVRSFRCWQQFLAMLFAQLTYRESLRDIEACLAAAPERIYHMGFTGPVARSTLADANEQRDWRMAFGYVQFHVPVDFGLKAAGAAHRAGSKVHTTSSALPCFHALDRSRFQAFRVASRALAKAIHRLRDRPTLPPCKPFPESHRIRSLCRPTVSGLSGAVRRPLEAPGWALPELHYPERRPPRKNGEARWPRVCFASVSFY